MKRIAVIAALAATVGVLGGAAWLWRQWGPPEAAPDAARPPLLPLGQASAPVPASPASSNAEPAHPIEQAAVASQGTAPPDIRATLDELFGHKAVLSTLQTDDFPRRIAATVDALGRSGAPSRLWPVNPAPGRFKVERIDDRTVISPDNSLRYTPFVLLVETVDMPSAAAAYVKLYPLFQEAYEQLGYPRRYFNDRLVEVIDQLLATPDVQEPIEVVLPQIYGPLQPERPWVLYEFADPALQSLSAGQKILLRMGAVNERRMKAKLAEFRRLVTAGAARR